MLMHILSVGIVIEAVKYIYAINTCSYLKLFTFSYSLKCRYVHFHIHDDVIYRSSTYANYFSNRLLLWMEDKIMR